MPLNIVIQTAFLGDLLLSIPLLKEARRQWPDHRLGLVCRRGLGDIFLKLGLVDELFEIEKGNRQAYKNILSKINQNKVDHVISPHQSSRTLLFVAQIKAQHKIGFKSFLATWFYNSKIKRDARLPDALRQLSLLGERDTQLQQKLQEYAVNAKPYELEKDKHLPEVPSWGSMSLRDEFFKSEEIYNQLKHKFNLKGFEEKKAILLFPGSVWATKRWTAEGFIGLGKSLQSLGYVIYVMGGPGEEELSERVASAIGCSSLAGQTRVYESAHLIARASLLVGNDSASTHLAAVTNTPLIAIFGPTVLEFGYRPWSSRGYIEQTELPCRPCGKHGHHRCPIGTHDCMKKIESQTVLQTALAILR